MYYPQTLRQLIIGKTLDKTLCKQLMVQILFGVAAIHKAEFAHNDLKPANILVSEEGVIKIGDFGLAGPQWTTQGLGTRDYAAPEMFSEKRAVFGSRVDCYRSDVWSVGVIFYLMLTGYFPFTSSQLKELQEATDLNALVNFDSKRLLPLEIDLLQSMLVLNPGKRKSSAELCNHAYFEGWKPSIRTDCSTPLVKLSLEKAKSTEPYRIDPNTGKAVVYISSKRTMHEDK